MKNKTRKTLEKFLNYKYRLILEGIVVGFFTGGLISLFRISLEKAEAFRGLILDMAKDGTKGVVFAFCLLAVAYYIVLFCGRKVPLCTGSGIPQIKGEILGQIEQNWWQVLIAKFTGCVCAIGAGLSLGREGPSVQLGGMVGKGFSRLTNRLRTEEKLLITCGAGAGISAAFSAPLAGVVFSLEELHKNFSTEILLSTMAASVTADAVATYIFGLSPIYGLSVTARLPLSRYWMVLLLGAVLGAFGVFYNRMTAKLQDFYGKLQGRAMQFALPFLGVILFAVIFPKVLGSGHHLVPEVAYGGFDLKILFALLILKFFFAVFSSASGAPGGSLQPLLVIGAITGGFFAEAIGGIFGFEHIYLENFVILGMAGYFASIIHAPITGVILITEMTGNFTNLLSLAVVALTAVVVADMLKGEPLFEQLLRRMLSGDLDYGTTEETRSHKELVESEVYIGSRMDGEKIEKMLLPAGCLVVSVQRENREIVPSGSTVLHGGDKLILLCSHGHVQMVEEKLKNICKTIKA